MSRELPDWLDTYLEYTAGSEPPTSYHIWCGMSVIAGALQRKVCLRMGFEEIYPNLYIILVGASGRTRKGVSLGIAKKLLQGVPGVSVAPESTSGREATVTVMKRALVNYEDPTTGMIKFHCSLSAFSEELSVFLGQGDVKYLANLTDWYDSKDNWEYESIGRGKDSLEGVCLNLAAGTAPDWIQSMLPAEAIGGGFTARVIFIVEEKKKHTVPEHILTERELGMQDLLVRDLERIAQISGEYTFDPEAREAYNTWYTQEDYKLSQGEQAVPDPRFSSYCERRQTHLRKIMMVLSASRGDDRIISLEDFARGLRYLTGAERNMHKTFGGLGKARHSDIQEEIIKYLRVVRITTRRSMMAKFYRDIDAPTLKNIEESLTHMGVVQIKLASNMEDPGSMPDKIYTWVGPMDGPIT